MILGTTTNSSALTLLFVILITSSSVKYCVYNEAISINSFNSLLNFSLHFAIACPPPVRPNKALSSTSSFYSPLSSKIGKKTPATFDEATCTQMFDLALTSVCWLAVKLPPDVMKFASANESIDSLKALSSCFFVCRVMSILH